MHTHQMSAADTGLLIIDMQEKLLPLIPDAAAITRNISFLLEVAKLLRLTVVATEQYPKGLGGTVAELASNLPPRLEKTAFSCCAVPEVTATFHLEARPKLLLAGIEAHVCVLQTALELAAANFRVFVVADAVGSRYRTDYDFALRRMEQAGIVMTTTETAAFELVGGAGTPEFKTLSKLVQERMQALGRDAH
jgi:nicotinamidase-related amidase